MIHLLKSMFLSGLDLNVERQNIVFLRLLAEGVNAGLNVYQMAR